MMTDTFVGLVDEIYDFTDNEKGDSKRKRSKRLLQLLQN